MLKGQKMDAYDSVVKMMAEEKDRIRKERAAFEHKHPDPIVYALDYETARCNYARSVFGTSHVPWEDLTDDQQEMFFPETITSNCDGPGCCQHCPVEHVHN